MDIRFKSPFSFGLQIVEVDDRVPSLRADIEIAVDQFQHAFQYKGHIWIECSVWDGFVEALHMPSREAVSLHGMNDDFALVLQETEAGIALTWRLSKTDLDGRRRMAVEFTCKVNEDDLAAIRRQFDEFPTWW